MFDSEYSYKLITTKKGEPRSDLIAIRLYSFHAFPNRRYIIQIEEYVKNIYVPKFYYYGHRLSPNKYNLLLNDYNAASIIRTCINICLDILAKNSVASFGLVASPIIKNSETEEKFNNKRFRIYSYVIANFFGPGHFYHFMNEQNSAYLLINRKLPDTETIAEEALEMFIRNYPELESM